MENTNALPKNASLAQTIDTPTQDAFSQPVAPSKEAELLVERIEQKEKGITPQQVVPVKTPKKETFLDRLLSNAGLGKNSQSTKPLVPGQPLVTSVMPKKTIDTSKLTKSFLLILIVLAFCSGLYLFTYFTNLDAQIVKITLSGTVTDNVGNKPVQDAEVFIDDTSVAKTDSKGQYSIKLEKLKFNFKVSKRDFNDFAEEVTIPRSILTYSFTKNVQIVSSKIATVKGKFTTDIANYKFNGDRLYFNNEEFPLKDDGSFDLTEVPTGNVKLTFQSVNFKDIDQEFTLNAGNNTIKDIKLTPAGDAMGSVISYVREDIVTKTSFSIENVQDNQITINDQGKFNIRDLDIGKTYKIRSTADGYKTRDYEITIKQGENEVFGFKMVEDGTATYVGRDNTLKEDEFYSTDLDGFNLQQLTTLEDFAPKKEYFNSQDGLLYFLSEHEKLNGSSGRVALAYTVNPSTKQVIKLTFANTTMLDTLIPNFKAKKMANIYPIKNDSQKRKQLQILDLDGNNLKVLRTVTGNSNSFDNITISGNGRYAYFREGDLSSRTAANPIMYRADSQSDEVIQVVQRKDVQIHAVSDDGNLVFYSALNEKSGLRDLMLFKASNNETRTIKENHDGNQYQFLNQNNDNLIFFAKRDGKMDVYMYSIPNNSTQRITNLASDDQIQYLYQQNQFAFYITKRGLYVIDILKPHSLKLVTDKVTKYTN